MARIKYGSLITDISGSIGGTTFQRSGSGSIIRNKPIPIRSKTASQMKIRSYMMEAHNKWLTLTDERRLQWNRFPAFSGIKNKNDKNTYMSGHALFIKYMICRRVVNHTMADWLTYTNTIPWYYPIGLETSAGEIRLIMEPAAVGTPEDCFLFLSISHPKPPSQKYNANSVIFVNLNDCDDWEELWFSEECIAALGYVPDAGSYIHVKWYMTSSYSPLFSNIFTSVFQVQSV
jgi:hypothetical protein